MENAVKETMMTYIEQSPEVVAENIKNAAELTKSLVNEYVEGNYKNIWIVASGSSYNGAYCGRQFMRKYLKCEVKIISPFTFVNTENDFTDDDLVFVVSQSGMSTNAIEALTAIKNKKRKAIGIVGNTESDFKDYADLLIGYGVGIEKVGYVTKGVTTFALYLMLFTIEAAKAKGLLAESDAKELMNELKKVPEIHKEVQKASLKFMEEHYKALIAMNKVYVMGCGANYGTALEGALKIGETVQIPAVAYETEELIHGPSLQLDPTYHLFFIEGGCASDRVHEIFKASRFVTDYSYLLTNNEKYQGEGILTVPFEMNELITPLCFLPFVQIIAYKVTDENNRWTRCPLHKKMDDAAASKTPNYKNTVVD